jgi:hypothetical protein
LKTNRHHGQADEIKDIQPDFDSVCLGSNPGNPTNGLTEFILQSGFLFSTIPA